jgi:UDP-N-acetylglucosamine 2-epimerase (non-hydrolysing)
MRANTERPITIEQGTNTLAPLDASVVLRHVDDILRHGGKRGRIPECWDGRTAARIADHLAGWLAQQAAQERSEATA